MQPNFVDYVCPFQEISWHFAEKCLIATLAGFLRKGMSSGPFGEGAEADLISEEINRYFAETGFIATLAGFLKFLLSIPNRPDQPTCALLEMLEIPHDRLDTNAKMAILHETRSELMKAVELNSKLKRRHDEIRKLFVNGQQTNCGQLSDYHEQHENQ
ncbi:unnamed protein product [Angiostrongylus costaricensis]|uniref:Cytochrome P450 n=1 Tax=Angiostrongylus costaricensis TaxID=334426 RepID=A0A0R3Q2A3_ANGCS|nr:unnamed protein product [Angiostrongylus costaricensis]